MSGRASGSADVGDAALAELMDWLRIPSISGDQRFAADVLHAARWLARWLRDAGAAVRLVPTGAAPLVTARFRGRSSQRPGVLYGHYDVQPPGAGWRSPPFEPQLRGGRLIARGASDDKGQFFAHLICLRNLARDGRLATDVWVLGDGAEEVGSPGLADAFATVARSARAVVISDTQRAAADVPSITVSQRGLLKLDVVVDVGGTAVHPGRFGGAVVDPSVVLAASITRLSRALRQLPAVAPATNLPMWHPSDRALERASGGREPARTAGNRHDWLTTHASVSVTRMAAGGPITATPTVAGASLDLRLPPGISPRPVARVVRKLLAAGDPRTTATVRAAARGLGELPPARVLAAAERASVCGFGTPPAYVRSGGSIPAAAHLASAFDVVPLLFGLGPPDDNAHGPNESLDIAGWRRSVHSCNELWRIVAGHPRSSRHGLPPRRPSEG